MHDATDFPSPLAGTVVACLVPAGHPVRAGQPVLLVEAMKMEHELTAPADLLVEDWRVAAGDTVREGQPLWKAKRVMPANPGLPPDGSAADGARPESAASRATPEPQRMPAPSAGAAGPAAPPPPADPVDRRAELKARLAQTLDAARPEAVARRHAQGLRTARENVADLCDPGSFLEYGQMAIAAQAGRRPLDELRRETPADGLVAGIGRVNGTLFGPDRARCAVLAYDATVLAGTQGARNHAKTDRLLALALRERLPVVLYAEGGGGRPGDTDMPVVAGLHVGSFAAFARLNGRVPTVGIAAGRCFAGNAALLGCCDLVIACRGSSLGMGGPAMIEGAGLGRVAPQAVGPAETLHAAGAVDLLATDEADATRLARQWLGYFQGALPGGAPPADAAPAARVPAQRNRAWDSRTVMADLSDAGTLMEVRSGFGRALHTALARINGRPVGLMTSNPLHGAGAIDADAADKGARFIQLCSAHGLPIVSLIDTPGFLVGPEAEAGGQIRHVARLFIAHAHRRVPLLAVVLRRGYGLGAMALAGGGFHETLATVAWPGAEFGAMGLEGAVRLGWRRELEALPPAPPGVEPPPPGTREARFAELLQAQIDAGRALRMAEHFEVDAVIDPDDTRGWIERALAAARPVGPSDAAVIDGW